MAAEWDAIVVGAGIIGCAVCRELSRRGLRTAIIEARGVAAGATQASAGMLTPFIEAPDDSPLHALAVRSFGMYDAFIADLEGETGQRIEYRRCGSLEVAPSADAHARLNARAIDIRAQGVEARWLQVTEVQSLEPQLTAHEGALLIPSHGYVVVAQLTQTLAEAAGRLGASLLRERVESIVADSAGVEVKTSAGTRVAPTVIVAAGSWSRTLLSDAPPVKPIRGQLVRLAWKGPPLRHIVWGERCYIVPWVRGTVLVGATVEDVGFDERATAAGVRELLDAAIELVPQACDATFVEVRVGLRPGTPDGLPIIGQSIDSPGVVFATGHYRNGVLLAPVTAALVADLVTNQGHDPALTAVSPARFQKAPA